MSWRADSDDGTTTAHMDSCACPSQEGDVLGGRFELVRRIGQGGFGIVYEARDGQSGVTVAVKLLREARAEWIDGFKREFRTLQDLKHPNLVALDELFFHGEKWFFTMELLQGEDLVTYVRKGAKGAPDEARLRDVFAQLLTGLAALHAAGKVHRDVKPSNVLVTTDGRAVLLDFGLVSDASQEGTPLPTLVGTPVYMPPEQIALLQVGPAADLYAAGVMLYESLTGELPFQGDPSRLLSRKRAAELTLAGFDGTTLQDLAALVPRLLHRDAAARPSAVDALRIFQKAALPLSRDATMRAASNPRLPPFVGRERELAALDRTLSDAAASSVATVHVDGVSGVGKTTLIRAFCNRARAEGRAFVLMGRSYERESVPFKAFDSLIDWLVQRLLELGPEAAALVSPNDWAVLARIFPAFRSLAGATPVNGEPAEPHVLRRTAFAALRSLLEGLAAGQPLVIWLDDVQWADSDSAALLNALYRPPRARVLLVILSYRSNEPAFGAFLHAVAPPEGTIVEHLCVRELSPLDSRELAEALLAPYTGFDGQLVDRAVRESEGNPLFMRQLCSLVGEGQERALSAAGLSLERVIALRFASLSATGKRVLEVCAVARHPVPQSACLRAAGLGDGGGPELAELRALNLIRTGGTARLDPVTTSHDRIAEGVLASLDANHLRELHVRLGDALEELPDRDPEMIAAHFEAGGEPARAGQYAVQAAELAASALAFDRAARLYQLALDLRPYHGGSELELSKALGESLVNAGRGRDAAYVFLRCAELSPAHDSLAFRRRAGEQLLRTGHVQEGFVILDRVRDAIGAPTPKSTGRALLSIARASLWAAIRGRRVVTRSEADLPRSDLERVDTLWSSTVATSTVDAMRGAEAQALHFVRALELGEPYRVSRAMSMQAAYAAVGGYAFRRWFETLIGEAREAASRAGTPHARALVDLAEGMGAWMLGEFTRARRACITAERIFRTNCVGATWEISTAQVFGYNSLAMLGELRELCGLSLSRTSEARERNDRYARWIPLSGFATIAYLASGRAEEAQAELDDALAHWPRDRVTLQHNYALVAQVLIDLYTGRESALLRRARAEWWALERSHLFRIQVVRIAFHLAVGSCAIMTRRARHGADVRRALSCARAVRAEGAPWGIPLSNMLRAAVVWQKQSESLAIDLLEQAISGFESVDMALHAAGARVRLGRILGGDRGATLVAVGEGFLQGQAVTDVGRMVRLVTPGFETLD